MKRFDYGEMSVDELDLLNVEMKRQQLAIREERQRLMAVRNAKVVAAAREHAEAHPPKEGDINISPPPPGAKN